VPKLNVEIDMELTEMNQEGKKALMIIVQKSWIG